MHPGYDKKVSATEYTEKNMKWCCLNKLQFARRIILVSLLCVLCGRSFAQDFKSVHPGLEYTHVDHKIGDDPVKINLLRLDPKKVRLDVYHAMDAAIGTETTSSIATRKGAI